MENLNKIARVTVECLKRNNPEVREGHYFYLDEFKGKVIDVVEYGGILTITSELYGNEEDLEKLWKHAENNWGE